MVDINNIVSRGGYLVDGVTGEKVLFYECDPRKNTECNREMCRGDGAEDEGGFGFCSKTLDPRYVESHLEIRPATDNGAYTSGRTIRPAGCVNHSVGCAQPSVDVFFNTMNKSSAGWGVNALLGDFHKGEGRIILALQWNGRPWGCGSGSKGSWNNTKVQWEICEPAGHTYAGGTMVGYDVAKNQGYFDRMWKMVVAWNVYMVKKFGYPISGISDHAESYRAGYGSNHGDVGQWWPKHGKSMDALRKEVQEILNGETEDDDMDVARFKELWGEMRKELQDNDASAYSAEAREWATKNGLIAGNGTTVSGEPNCMWGDILTREQFVTVLYRWTQMMGKA